MNKILKCMGYDERKRKLKKLINEQNPKPTLVLDIDHTLLIRKFTSTGEIILYRPYLDEFLEAMAELYNIVLFSHGKREYVQSLTKKMDPNGRIFKAIFTRNDCDYIGYNSPVKDLSKLHVNLNKTILIDDTPNYAGLQPNNFITIKRFYGESNDNALLVVSKIRKDLINYSDFTDYVKELKT
ncbi:hypothetical protein A3Q56_06612 [Intoshia linei]|uniref:Mitochondrial import inner membrane translocase subunit TIM50 n=1 Tax=Intoshia linei TaxID=1819745 RepID=A0A177AUM9_9BILA|nr:hypothetical protein A3Q56_06612 [Intoshia linei]